MTKRKARGMAQKTALLIFVWQILTIGITATLVHNFDNKKEAVAPVEPKETPDPLADFTYSDLLVRMNDTRLAHGLDQIGTDSYLSLEAQKDLAGNCPVNSHDNFEKEFNSGKFTFYKGVAEILTSSASDTTTPLDALNALLSSPAHADILTNPRYNFKRVGIGVVTSPVNCVSFIFSQ